MVSDVPLTVAVAVWMREPELLTVGVVPPLPYPLPYLPLLLVGVLPAEVLEVAFGAAVDPVLVLLPHAANRTRATNASMENKARTGAFEDVRLLCIVCSFLQSWYFV